VPRAPLFQFSIGLKKVDSKIKVGIQCGRRVG
jgi:hypothetical protein